MQLSTYGNHIGDNMADLFHFVDTRLRGACPMRKAVCVSSVATTVSLYTLVNMLGAAAILFLLSLVWLNSLQDKVEYWRCELSALPAGAVGGVHLLPIYPSSGGACCSPSTVQMLPFCDSKQQHASLLACAHQHCFGRQAPVNCTASLPWMMLPTGQCSQYSVKYCRWGIRASEI